jgi:hypothetical protein
MEPVPENQEISVKLPASYIRNLYAVLLVANNRANWHPDELVPVGKTIQELKVILQKIKEEETKEETKEEETKEEPGEDPKEE